jgi:hypothetical protein
MAVPGRLELPTFGLGNRCSIRLSYGTGLALLNALDADSSSRQFGLAFDRPAQADLAKFRFGAYSRMTSRVTGGGAGTPGRRPTAAAATGP